MNNSVKLISHCLFAGFLSISTVAAGSGFMEKFKDFVVGAEQQSKTDSTKPFTRLPPNSISSRCMGCHDGSRAQGIRLKHADTTMVFTGHGSSNHPVGMNYRNYAGRNPAVFVAPENLDRRIILEDGEVTCISCHSLRDSLSHKGEGMRSASVAGLKDDIENGCMASRNLTVGPSPTSLCLSCHAM
jgi:hypothetical protein